MGECVCFNGGACHKFISAEDNEIFNETIDCRVCVAAASPDGMLRLKYEIKFATKLVSLIVKF